MTRPMHIQLMNHEGHTEFNVALTDAEVEFVQHLCVLSEAASPHAWNPVMRLHNGPIPEEEW